MKKLTLIFTLLFSTVMFSSTSFAGWKKVDESMDGDTFYVDFERIRKVDGYVYYWDLTDYLKLTEEGHLSGKTYKQGDCKLFRFKDLSVFFHKEPMGRGTGEPYTPPDKWYYPPPNSSSEVVLKSVCESVK